jgi:predicted  nucleic acid-binding Zn-ribbon protein
VEVQAEFERRRAEHTAEIEAAVRALDALKSELSTMAETQAQLANVSVELEDATARVASLSEERAALTSEVEALRESAAEAQDDRAAAHAEAERLSQTLGVSETRLRATEDQLIDLEQAKTARQAEIMALDAEVTALRATAEKARGDIATLKRALSMIGDELAGAPATAVSVSAGIAQGEAPEAAAETPVALSNPVPMASDTIDESAPAAVGRIVPAMSREGIRALLRTAPGLADAGASEIALLTAELEAGVCPVDALKKVFGVVNRQTLVALVRGMGTC